MKKTSAKLCVLCLMKATETETETEAAEREREQKKKRNKTTSKTFDMRENKTANTYLTIWHADSSTWA